MKEVKTEEITAAVAELCMKANYELSEDVLLALRKAYQKEDSPLAKDALAKILKNSEIAIEEKLPLCQDCGTVVIFIDIGQEVNTLKSSTLLEVKARIHYG